MVEVEQQHAAELQKVNRLRRQLASVSQAAARTARQVDDCPVRAELLQYEKRFVELYRLVQEKLSETRKYYALYNSLRDELQYAQTEQSLLDSIISQYPAASQRKQGKEQFVQHMDTVLHGLHRQREQKEQEMEREKQQLAAMQAEALSMQEKQRAYFKAVRGQHSSRSSSSQAQQPPLTAQLSLSLPCLPLPADFQEECFRNEKLLELQQSQTQADGAEAAAD